MVKLTCKFPTDKYVPREVGVYETPKVNKYVTHTFQHWNGKFWSYYAPTVSRAAEYEGRKSARQPSHFRGLREKP